MNILTVDNITKVMEYARFLTEPPFSYRKGKKPESLVLMEPANLLC